MKEKLIDKKYQKQYDKECFICGENDYATLDCHRILEGKNGGTYHSRNVLTLCSNCHRKVHAGQIVIDRKYQCTNGSHVLRYFIDGKEFWK